MVHKEVLGVKGLKNGFIISGLKVSLWPQMSVPFSWGMRLGHAGKWIPTFRWYLQGIVGCFKTLHQKMWDFISGRNKYIKCLKSKHEMCSHFGHARRH
jgi:hypothetical protein